MRGVRKTSGETHRERRKALIGSATLHLLLFILLIAGLPSFLEPKHEAEPTVLTVEILPITNVTNVKPVESTPAPKKEPEKKMEAKKPAPPVKTADNTPPPPPPQPVEKKVEKKAEEKKPEEKKPEKKKMKQEDLLAVLKAVKETASQESKKNTKTAEASEQKPNNSQQYNPDLPLSLSEKDAIKSQIAKCWSVPAGAKDAQNLVIWLHAQYQQDGSLINVELADQSKSRYGSDPFFRAAADSAKRAVQMCTPLHNLPPEKFGGPNGWHDILMDFDPKDMLG